MKNKNMKNGHLPVAPLALIAMPGFEKFTERVNEHILSMRTEAMAKMGDEFNGSMVRGYNEDSFLCSCRCPRFGTGEAKGEIIDSVRGKDVFVLTDVTNYSLSYTVCGQVNHMSPDDHYQNLKRIIAAAIPSAHRVNVVMPFLYESRQHKRAKRESLDCALALEELSEMGVTNIITFDAHDPRVQNSIPLHGLDNFMPTYQFIKAIFERDHDLQITKESLMVISPDEGALDRNMYFSSVLGCNLGMFYKRRDYSRVVNGRNPIVAHEYLGESVEGKTVFIVDDIISSGDSMLEVANELKQRGAKQIICNATFPLFTSGLARFDKAVADGTLTAVLGTNLTYRMPELLTRDWYFDVDCSKYTAYFIAAINHDMSVSSICDPIVKIKNLLDERK